MKKFRNIAVLVAAFLAAVSIAPAAESKFASGTTNATVAFGADQFNQQEVTALLAKSDSATAAVKFFARGGGGKLPINVASTSGAQVVYFANSGFATNDLVVYQHSDGTVLCTTIAGSITTGGCTLATGLTQAGTTNDRIYEVTQQGQADVGTTALNLAGYTIFVAPSDSPLVLQLLGNTNVTITATKKP